MWNDRDDTLEQVFDRIMDKKGGDVPLICPVCGRKQVHFYFHKWNEKSDKGGMWIWCSGCKSFSHGTVQVPEWWENCNEISLNKLNSLPDYLEDHKEKIDHYVNELRKKN